MYDIIDVENSFNSGQIFLWEKIGNEWYVINGSDVIVVKKHPFETLSYSNKPIDFFRESDNITKIFKEITKDRIVKSAVRKFPGLRILRQDPFQCYITFILSSNSNIKNIKQSLQRLCSKFGTKIKYEGKKFCLFPKPSQLVKAQKNELRECSLGYRAKSVKIGTDAVMSGEIDFDFLKKTDYYTAKDSLTKIFGIGNKIADCILLFSLEKLEAFPLDRWILRVLQKYYSDKFRDAKTITEKKYKNLHEEIVKYFGPYAGYSQQYLFKMERELNQKKWL